MGPRHTGRRLATIQVVGIDGRVKSYEVGKNGHVPVPKQRRREEEELWPLVCVTQHLVSPTEEEAPRESGNDSPMIESIRDFGPVERHAPEKVPERVPEIPMPQNEDWLFDVFVLGDGPLEHFYDMW
jgi:hypothetical protein